MQNKFVKNAQFVSKIFAEKINIEVLNKKNELELAQMMKVQGKKKAY